MSDLGHDALKEPVGQTFDLLSMSEQEKRLHELNIGLVSLNGSDLELNVALEQASSLGYRPFRWQNVKLPLFQTPSSEVPGTGLASWRRLVAAS